MRGRQVQTGVQAGCGSVEHRTFRGRAASASAWAPATASYSFEPAACRHFGPAREVGSPSRAKSRLTRVISRRLKQKGRR
jgi:hypothetical protein